MCNQYFASASSLFSLVSMSTSTIEMDDILEEEKQNSGQNSVSQSAQFDAIDGNKDGKVTYEEWCNWIKSTNESFEPKNDAEKLFQTQCEFEAWQHRFFELSKGSKDSNIEIQLDELDKYIRDKNDKQVPTL